MEEVKKIPFLRKVLNPEAGSIRFVLGNGQEVVCELGKVGAANRERALYHGLSQKIGDSVAGYSKDSAFGAAFAELSAVRDQMYSPDWSSGREGGGGSAIELLVQALARVKKLDIDVVRAAVEKATGEQRKTWTSNAKVAEVIQKIKSEQATARAKETKATADEIDLGI